jgi:ArsR family transcriptional regulator
MFGAVAKKIKGEFGMDIVEVLKSLGEPLRLRIMNLLRVDTLCVCDLEKILNVSQSNVSRHLATLRHAGLIVSEKKAQWVYYRLNPNALTIYPFLGNLLADALIKLPQCQADLGKLKRYHELGGDCTHDVNMEKE